MSSDDALEKTILFERLLPVRRSLALHTVLDDPRVALDLVKRQPFLRVEHQELLQLVSKGNLSSPQTEKKTF